MKKPQAGWTKTRNKWEAKGIDPLTGKRKSYYGDSKQEAERKALDSFGIPEDDSLYSFYAHTYLRTILTRSTAWKAQVGWAMDKYVIPEFGHVPIKDITRAGAQKLFNRIARKRKASTLARIKIVFSCVMNLAVQDELIGRNPVSFVRLPREEDPDKRALSFAELRKLLDAARPCIKPYIALSGCCGLRPGEALGTRRNAVQGHNLHVRRQILQPKGGCVDTDVLKTPQSKRVVPLPKDIEDMLDQGQVSSIWICSDTKGGYMTPNNAARELAAAVVESGIGHVTPHELRHTFISLMENELGCPPAIVAKLAGKTYKSMTAGYSHANLEQMRKWMEVFAERLSTSLQTTGCLQSG